MKQCEKLTIPQCEERHNTPEKVPRQKKNPVLFETILYFLERFRALETERKHIPWIRDLSEWVGFVRGCGQFGSFVG